MINLNFVIDNTQRFLKIVSFRSNFFDFLRGIRRKKTQIQKKKYKLTNARVMQMLKTMKIFVQFMTVY